MLTNSMAKIYRLVWKSIRRDSFLYVGNINSLLIYIIFNTYVTMSYAVFSVLNNGIAKRTFATLLP